NSFLKESFFTSNETLYEILTNYLKDYFNIFDEDSKLLGIVFREIIRQTSNTLPTISQVSSSIGMSERTLRRRLANEGTSFQEAKNTARRKWAKYYLSKSNLSLTEIAFELGFSELSAFSRAFRHWVGETPQAYRNRIKKL
ncbi:MAG: helix-turn-helix transcriptional regulator, partial [Gammaproteobacteria bacterium]|nr:helix-turn-helix transcriptional regulator [Gammaproteobacteria bacterium]